MMNHYNGAYFRAFLLASLLLAVSGYARADLSPPNLEYREDTVDLKVKVMGGFVTIKRTRENWEWDINRHWKGISFTLDNIDGSIKTITRAGVEYLKKSPGVYAMDVNNTITTISTGYRWQDRGGNWIEYDTTGRTTSYGNRNNVKVSFQYDAQNRIGGVLDHFGTQVLWYEYTGDYLTAIRDYTNRRVQYEFTALPNTNGAIDLTKVIDVRGNAWTYAYESNQSSPTSYGTYTPSARRGRVFSRTDPEGRTKRIVRQGASVSEKDDDNIGPTYLAEYDATKKITYTRETSPGGKVMETWTDAEGKTIRRDINGKIVSTTVPSTSSRTDTTTDERGNKTITVKDEWGNVTKTTYPDGASISFTYDATYGNVTQKIDERGTITNYQYDAKGNLIKLTEAVGKPEQRITEYTYDAYGNKLTEKRVGDAVTAEAVTTFGYDGYGNVATVIDAENNTTSYTRDVTGNVLTLTDARMKVWKTTFDAAGNVKTTTNPLNQTTTTDYDKVGNRIKVADALNNASQFVYNRRDNLIRIVDAAGGISQMEYDADGKVVRQIDAEGKIQRMEYDLDGRLRKTLDGNGNATQYIYGDASSGLGGLLAKTIYPTFTQEFKYDNRDRIAQTIDVLDANTRYTTTVNYDAAGNQTNVTDRENRTTQYEYDALNRLVKITDAASGITRLTYDSRDKLISLTDPKTHVFHFEYDRLNRRTKEVRPLGQAISFKYDATGNLIDRLDAKGQARRYAYDDAGRLESERYYLNAGDAAALKTVSYSYSATDRLTGYDDGTTSAIYARDALDRKTGETVNYGAFTLSYSYTYYANGNKKTFTDAHGTTYTYAYDSNNQLSAIGLPVGSISYNGYEWQAPTGITLPGGTTQQFTYDPLQRLKTIAVKDAGQNAVMHYQYTHDKVGNIAQIDTEQGILRYSYDALYRLTQATIPTLPVENYTYDPAHNRATDSQIAGTISYNDNNELTQYGYISYAYDANGNTVTKTSGTTVTEYAYDAMDRLIEIEEANTTRATYYYNPFGKRLSKEVDGVKTYYFYSDEGLISEHTDQGTLTRTYGYRPGSDFTSHPLFQKTVDISNNTDAYYYYHNDHLGTPQKLTDVQGAIVWSAAYAAFGSATIAEGSTVANPLRFPGQYEDEESGLRYNYYRFYDVETGRYREADPAYLSGGINLYVYADNTPINSTDAYGLRGHYLPGPETRVCCLNPRQHTDIGCVIRANDTMKRCLGAVEYFAIACDYACGGAAKTFVQEVLCSLTCTGSVARSQRRCRQGLQIELAKCTREEC